MNCELCNRETSTTKHHLIPQCRGSDGVTIDVCSDCHSAIHNFFSNKELERVYNTKEKLMAHEKFANHIKWLSKQNPDEIFKTKIVNNHKGIYRLNR